MEVNGNSKESMKLNWRALYNHTHEHCAVPENIYSHPRKVIGNLEKEGGGEIKSENILSKTEIPKERYRYFLQNNTIRSILWHESLMAFYLSFSSNFFS